MPTAEHCEICTAPGSFAKPKGFIDYRVLVQFATPDLTIRVFRAAVGRACGIALVTLGLAVGGCGERTKDVPPDVVLITIDTLRPDRLSTYGHDRETSPTIDAIAAQGVRFSRAYSTSSWTAPSVVSLLTSAHPARHGVVRGAFMEGMVHKQEILPGELAYLPEWMQQAGYRTFGVIANAHLGEKLGFARGFDYFESLGFADADRVREAMLPWREALTESTPIYPLDPPLRPPCSTHRA